MSHVKVRPLGRLVAVDSSLPLGPGLFRFSPRQIVLEECGVAVRVGETGEVTASVVGEAGDAAVCIGLAGATTESVVEVAGAVAVGVGAATDTPYRVVQDYGLYVPMGP